MAVAAYSSEQELLAALRAGEEAAFMALVEQYHASMVRLAASYVGSTAAAEDVAQETWAKVLRSLHQFEGRSSFKTWLFRILTNTALTVAKREGRQVVFSDLAPEADEPAVEPERFVGAGDAEWGGHWVEDPRRWKLSPEDQVAQREVLAMVGQAIEALPDVQRAVLTLHDVEGVAAKEICNILGLSETNQRVLLHRARAKVRRALESWFDQEAEDVR